MADVAFSGSGHYPVCRQIGARDNQKGLVQETPGRVVFMTHGEIREKFIKFFEERGHKLVPSSSLLPTDPSVLFTTAGMQQFKPYYTGEADPMKDFGLLNTVSVQKCVRTSDIEQIGDDSHLTFLEMLGNFSFGGYFKDGAIKWAHEFITKELGLKIDYVSVFAGEKNVPADEESEKIWKSIDPDIVIKKFGRADNFWGPTGDEGPCGPTSEIYINGIEVWNLVFNEFFCDKNSALSPLAKKGIDTGMGLERLATAVQKKTGVFETDLFVPIMEEVRGKNLYDYEQNRVSERIIADHLRASVFLIADGVTPSNVEQGYVLRRLLRRAIRHAKLLNQPEDIYERVLHVLAHDIYRGIYPELKSKQKEILEVILAEKDKFTKTLDRGLREFGKLMEEMISRGEKVISGKNVFDLYATFGFPIELIEELAKEKGLTVDVNGFEGEINEHKAKSRAGVEKKFGGHGLVLDTGELKAGGEEELAKVTRLHTATHLLHAALRKVLGDEVRQAGSDITPERLRFDFAFPRKVTAEELKKIEGLVNKAIADDLAVTMNEMPYEEAIKSGALAFFKQKYPEVVKVYTIGGEEAPFSREICGGPHVARMGEISKFKIVKEESVSAGTRRIRATVE
jgi:alanyl-tRNA synthetase